MFRFQPLTSAACGDPSSVRSTLRLRANADRHRCDDCDHAGWCIVVPRANRGRIGSTNLSPSSGARRSLGRWGPGRADRLGKRRHSAGTKCGRWCFCQNRFTERTRQPDVPRRGCQFLQFETQTLLRCWPTRPDAAGPSAMPQFSISGCFRSKADQLCQNRHARRMTRPTDRRSVGNLKAVIHGLASNHSCTVYSVCQIADEKVLWVAPDGEACHDVAFTDDGSAVIEIHPSDHARLLDVGMGKAFAYRGFLHQGSRDAALGFCQATKLAYEFAFT